MKVLCDAVPFGYGPISKLLAVSRLLPSSWELTLLASGTSLDLARVSGFASIVPCDTEDASALAVERGRFVDADLLINIMNPTSLVFAASCGLQVAEIDSLFWMWDGLDPEVRDAAAFYIQDFPGVEEAIKRLSPANPIVVPPIVDDTFRGAARDNQLVIELGGLRSRLIIPGTNSDYPHLVARMINAALDGHEFDRVLVACHEVGVELTRGAWRVPRLALESLGHDAFLAELARSRLLVCSPGLTTTYEGLVYEVPTVFLPPQNYSQWLILDTLRDHGGAPHSLHWTDVIEAPALRRGMPEAEGVAAVLDTIARVATSEAAEIRAAEALRSVIDGAIGELQNPSKTEFGIRIGRGGAERIATDLVMRFGR